MGTIKLEDQLQELIIKLKTFEKKFVLYRNTLTTQIEYCKDLEKKAKTDEERKEVVNMRCGFEKALQYYTSEFDITIPGAPRSD